MPRSTIIIAAAVALAVTLPAVSAQAQAPRTFVSAAGSDSNPCSFAAPCRHFQAAVNATSAGGEVDALDPAGYGPITISQGITIEGQGWSYIAPPNNGNGITINAGNGNVIIHGVSINGAGITGSTFGIIFNSGASLTVDSCVIRGVTVDGIRLIPSSSGALVKLFVSNSQMSSNGSAGIFIFPSGAVETYVSLNHVETNNNGNFGVLAKGSNLTIGAIFTSITDSVASSNGSVGFYNFGTGNLVQMMIFRSVANFNNFGAVADGGVLSDERKPVHDKLEQRGQQRDCTERRHTMVLTRQYKFFYY